MRLRVPFSSSRTSPKPLVSASEAAAQALSRADSTDFDGDSGSEDATGPRSEKNNFHRAQPSGQDGVDTGMATLVLDNALLAGSGAGIGTELVVDSGQGVAELDEDAILMLRAAQDDEEALNRLVGKYYRPITHFLYRMVHSEAVAEELAQEVFLRVYRARASYRAEARFSTWLYRIATNLGVNHARDTKREREAGSLSLDEPDPETGIHLDVADSQTSVEERLVANERMEAIRAHVMALPERQRMAVLMHKYQEMDYRQIGEVLKLSESATKSLLFRAYQSLRTSLKDFA